MTAEVEKCSTPSVSAMIPPGSGLPPDDFVNSTPINTARTELHSTITRTLAAQGVLVEEDCTTCVMGHVEAICKKFVVDAVRRFLQGNDMPPSCNLLFEGIFFSPTGSRVPVVDAESPLHNRTSRKAFIGTVHVRRGSVFPFGCLAKLCCSLLNIHHMLDQDFVLAHFDP